jgi:hypothetical protein
MYAVWWHIYDNECNNPATSDCAGWWLLKPDGTRSVALTSLLRYAGWACQHMPYGLHLEGPQVYGGNTFYWDVYPNNLVWVTENPPGAVVNYHTTMTPPDIGQGDADTGTEWWRTPRP